MRWVVLATVGALAVRLLFVGTPLSSDEAGFLLVGAQWHHGSSLYGDYWVDRPPGLVSVFAVAAAAGGRVALRVIGALCAAAAVLAAGWLARTVAPHRPRVAVLTAVVAAALLGNPLLDVTVVDGEILALPCVLVGITALVLCARRGSARWALLAGAAGAGSLMIKQNFVEVPVAALVVCAFIAVRIGVRAAGTRLALLVIGASIVIGPLLALCLARGTSLPDLWWAVVSFRADAGSVIATSASSATPQRALRLAGAVLASGMLLALPLVRRLPWRRTAGGDPALAWVTTVVVALEVGSVTLGGSYWLHYLVQLVPGVALLVAVTGSVADESEVVPRPLLGTSAHRLLAVAITSTAVVLTVEVMVPREPTSSEVAVVRYLRAHADRGSTVVVAYGDAALVYATGMSSPYPDLWSLPVRVRDPELTRLSAVLDSPSRPHWVVMSGDSLTTWGVDGTAGDLALGEHYAVAFTTDRYRVLEADS